MADNVVTSAAIGTGVTLAADDISSVFYQRVKLSLGADGSAVDAVAGAGVVGTGVQRVTLASDDPGVTSLALIDNVIYVDDAAWTGDTSSHALVGGIYQSTPQTITDGRTGPLLLDANGRLIVKAGANSGVDIGDVDVTSVIAGTGATNLGKAEDAGHSSGDTGVFVLSVRRDTATQAAGTAADYAAINTDSLGKVWTRATPEGTAYETVAASATDQALGATGATGDYLAGVLIVPGTTSPGAVSIKDGAGSAITIFTGGASSVSNLVPFMVPLGILSAAGAWQITTGANVTAIGVGTFT